MSKFILPFLDLNNWKETRNTLQIYSKIVSEISHQFRPHQKNWDEHGLKINAFGLTSGIMNTGFTGEHNALEITINIPFHMICIRSSSGKEWKMQILGHSVSSFRMQILEGLKEFGVYPITEISKFSGDQILTYEKSEVLNYWNAVMFFYIAFNIFKSHYQEEFSDIILWPHHFDVSMLWLSGGIILDTDISKFEESREQINFGFSTGDETIEEAYFYLSVFPKPEYLSNIKLPEYAKWSFHYFNGLALNYNQLRLLDKPMDELLNLMKNVLNETKQLFSK